MKLNKIFATVAIGAFAWGTTGCDNIDSDDRYVELPDVVIDEEEIPRWVLLEEFTGQLCVNCPAAHETINSLIGQWGERFVPVSIHCGSPTFGIPDTETSLVGLQTTQGEAYFNAQGGLGVNTLPCGIVNRKGGMAAVDSWAESIYDFMKTTSPLNMELTPTLNGSSIDISLTVEANEAVSGKVLLWVVESDIVAMQLLKNNKVDMNYVHNHVFRATVNGADGDDFSIGADQEATRTFSIAVGSTWNTDHVSVVAFVYNADGVVQVVDAHLGTTVANVVKE